MYHILCIFLNTDIPELVVLETRPSRNLSITTVYFTQCQPSWDDETDLYSQLVKFALLYALPLLFISVTYYQIVRVLWRSARLAIINHHGNRSNTNHTTDDEGTSHNGTSGMNWFQIMFNCLVYFTVANCHQMTAVQSLVKLNYSIMTMNR